MARITVAEAREWGWQGDEAADFTAWRNAMDLIVLRKTGMDLDSFPDWDFASAYRSGQSPENAAREFLVEQAEEMGFDVDELDWGS